MSSKRKGEKEDSCVGKAARFFLACKQNPDPAVKVNILQAMRSWGYSNEEILNRTWQMQVRWAVKALKGEDTTTLPPASNPAAMAVTALLALAGEVDESDEGSSLEHHVYPRVRRCLHCCCSSNRGKGGNDG